MIMYLYRLTIGRGKLFLESLSQNNTDLLNGSRIHENDC